MLVCSSVDRRSPRVNLIGSNTAKRRLVPFALHRRADHYGDQTQRGQLAFHFYRRRHTPSPRCPRRQRRGRATGAFPAAGFACRAVSIGSTVFASTAQTPTPLEAARSVRARASAPRAHPFCSTISAHIIDCRQHTYHTVSPTDLSNRELRSCRPR